MVEERILTGRTHPTVLAGGRACDCEWMRAEMANGVVRVLGASLFCDSRSPFRRRRMKTGRGGPHVSDTLADVSVMS